MSNAVNVLRPINLPVKNRAIKKKKRISRIKPKETLNVLSRRLESGIEKRKVARLIVAL